MSILFGYFTFQSAEVCLFVSEINIGVIILIATIRDMYLKNDNFIKKSNLDKRLSLLDKTTNSKKRPSILIPFTDRQDDLNHETISESNTIPPQFHYNCNLPC